MEKKKETAVGFRVKGLGLQGQGYLSSLMMGMVP